MSGQPGQARAMSGQAGQARAMSGQPGQARAMSGQPPTTKPRGPLRLENTLDHHGKTMPLTTTD